MLPFQGLLLWSDLQKSLTDTGLTPSPARWDVQINPTLSVIALTCSLPYRIIIKRFCLLVKVFSFSAMSFPPVPSAFCLLIFYPCNRSRHKYQNHCDHSDKHHRPALFLLPVVVPVFSVPFVIVGFSTDFLLSSVTSAFPTICPS